MHVNFQLPSISGAPFCDFHFGLRLSVVCGSVLELLMAIKNKVETTMTLQCELQPCQTVRRAFPNVTRCVSRQRRAQNLWIYRPQPPTRFAQKKILQFWAIEPGGLVRAKSNLGFLRFTTVLSTRHHVFTERVGARKIKFAFYYTFGRSTPRIYREAWFAQNQTWGFCVLLQF